MAEGEIRALQGLLQQFATDRDWDQFHNPKNLVMALTGEVGELVEIFQWLTPDEAAAAMSVPAVGQHISDELADVFGYVLRVADILDVDLVEALNSKLVTNARKYPVDKARGSSAKYSDLK